MSDTSVSQDASDLTRRIQDTERRLRRRSAFLLIAVCLLLALQIAVVVLGLSQLRATKKNIEDLKFSQDVADYLRGADFISIQVGTIQFLRHGYSITLDSARYSQDGLTLSGTIGNPTQVWISSLTLNFSVRPYPYQVRGKWNKETFVFWNPSDFEIGRAQVNVGQLNAGSTTPFSLTIPNVKQTSEELQVAVWFSGERYTYFK